MSENKGQVAKRKSVVADLLDTYSGDLARVMPKHTNAEAFMGLALSAVRKDANLRNAVSKNPGAFMFALRECAALGHMPQKGIFALVPFNDKNAEGGVTIVGMEEVRGVIERMYRAGAVMSVKVQTVRENDPHFKWAPTRMNLPEHEFDALADEEDRGPLTGAYAWAVMADGVTTSQCVVMGRSEIMKHRAKSKMPGFIWDSVWEPRMWEKTVLHALERLVPTSAEYLAQRMKSAVEAGKGGFVDLPEPVFVRPSPDDIEDAEVVGDSEPAVEDPPIRTANDPT